MNTKISWFVLFLVLINPVFALTLSESQALAVQNNPTNNPSIIVPGGDVAQYEDSRMLAAQVTQEIRKVKEDVISEVNAYNDENFQIFDARLQQTITDIKMKIALGAIGAALIANALVAFIIMRSMKNYSYEKYQEKIIGKLEQEAVEKDNTIKGLQQMAEPSWHPQPPAQTMGVMYGQEFASDATQMNSWQAQPAYQGGWQSPVDVQPEYSHVPTGYKYTEPNYDDPMQSPQWNPQGDNK